MIRIDVLSVDNSSVRIRINQHGSVEYFCLNDIVKYLGRAKMIENGCILKIYKSVTRHPFNATPYLWQCGDSKIYPFGTLKRWSQAGRVYLIELWNKKSGM